MVCVPVCDLRKKYETKISNKVKENVNKLMVIGAVDFKMMYEMLKEADKFHKEKMDGFVKNMKMQMPDGNVAEHEADDTSDVFEDSGEVTESDEGNIFVEKN
jgi:hypothetical protein